MPKICTFTLYYDKKNLPYQMRRPCPCLSHHLWEASTPQPGGRLAFFSEHSSFVGSLALRHQLLLHDGT